MKRKIAIATTAVLAMAMCFSMTACKEKSVSKLLPSYKGSYSTTVNTLTGFSADVDYDQETYEADSNGVVVLSKTATNAAAGATVTTYYSLYNVFTNTTIVDNVAESIERLNDTLYYAVNAVDNTYTLYDSASGVYASAVKGAANADTGVFTRENGTRIYVAPNGDVKEETNPFEQVVSANAYEIGDYYVEFTDMESGIFDVYNAKGELKKSANLMIELGVSADAETVANWTVGNKIFFQTIRELPDADEDYDFYVEETKYELNTYSYSIKKGEGKKLKDFKYIVNDTDSYNDSSVIATVQKVTDKSLSQEYVQSFDGDGKVLVDLQKLVPGANDFDIIDIDKLALYDGTGYKYIYKGEKRLAKLPKSYHVMGNYVFNPSNAMNGTLNIYDFKGNSVLTVENLADINGTYDGNLIYSVKAEETETTPVTYASHYIFDAKKGTSTLIGTDSETVSYDAEGLGYTVTTISGETETSVYHFFDCDTTITGDIDSIASVESEDGKEYSIIEVENNGTSTFYSVVVSYPHAK